MNPAALENESIRAGVVRLEFPNIGVLNGVMTATNDYMPRGDPTLVLVLTAAVLLPPCYYLWKAFTARVDYPRRSAWPPIILLFCWGLQFPLHFYVAMTHYCEDCRGKPATPFEMLYTIGVVLYNVVPAVWLWRRSAAAQGSD
jgi:hypothetical protein